MPQAVRPAQPIPILTYHQIAPPPPRGTPFRSLCVSPAAFARQMGLLRRLGYRGCSMRELMPYLRGERQGKVVGITLDDGYANNLQHALPVLQRHGFTATCYALSQMLGQTNAWDAPHGVPAAALMTAEELRAWVAAGMEVGAHTRHHVDLTACDEATALEEITLSKIELQTRIQTGVEHFCYPYGRWQPVHERMAAQAGYQTATTTQRGRVRAGHSLLALPRIPVVRSTTLLQLVWKVATAYEDRHGG